METKERERETWVLLGGISGWVLLCPIRGIDI